MNKVSTVLNLTIKLTLQTVHFEPKKTQLGYWEQKREPEREKEKTTRERIRESRK